MQIELLNRRTWRTYLELAIAMADYIEHFYNCERGRSPHGCLTPNEFEAALLTPASRPLCPKTVDH